MLMCYERKLDFHVRDDFGYVWNEWIERFERKEKETVGMVVESRLWFPPIVHAIWMVVSRDGGSPACDSHLQLEL